MLKIKLKPTGKIHQRSFRIVISPDRSKSNGKFIDDIGFYTPQTKTLQIDKEKMAQWLKNGAQLTEGVDKLLNPDKYPRKKKNKKIEKAEKAPEKKTEVKIETKTEASETPVEAGEKPAEAEVEIETKTEVNEKATETPVEAGEKPAEAEIEAVKEEIPENKE
ncbi:MAG: 30S ribosomal protein S16 [Candidatus Shapirobacteria bacterium GW2011_GWE1_38_10]|uniref:Small ribosomal subunit protein bS16 n=1 Tax=Candidatus Shapirobacteria bacterium GW2011_GWE1_38_10 TaxID=1618488 RepID=A0A0G0IH72_9BACT|nr:MAG: 30S ribosomal protein S16 [Candidatus Shapirobacteria bacterium GW2011_GWF2_37_20]KKQ50350.1 MAG: 30S ribosomal protein S16 [Candidatus Shapirobacteria bacterium GW2011_GWE1_38_10]KKQ65173.1 MAG: 30S ribosomal protein S16 [Candidatus Shapirobacteria bacterium GW2011_GWF1_38_23]HBP50964.1 30S ribosomal protein S16 [Candidatus Shapirobacteria bacterium]